MFKRNQSVFVVILVACLSLTFIVTNTSLADQYPRKDIRCIIGYPPGGSIDALARLVAKYAPTHLGAEMKVINKPGAGGELALNNITNAKPDGYTIGHVVITNATLKPALRPKGQVGFKNEDIDYIVTLSKLPMALFVAPKSKFNSLNDLVDFAKTNPGKLTCATAGAYTVTDAARFQVEKALGIKLRRVSFQGGGPMRKAIAGGHVDIMSSNAFFTVRAKDTLKPLGVAGEKPFSLAPHVPTYKSQGFNIVDYLTRGFGAPLGIPEERLAHLEKGFEKMSQDPEFLADMKKIGYPVEFHGRAETKDLVQQIGQQYKSVIAEFKAEIAAKLKK